MQPDGESRLKRVGTFALFPLGLIAVLFLTVLTLRGVVWASDKFLPWLMTASEVAITICVFVLLPLCIFRKSRPWAGVAFVYASLLFGLVLFAWSCVFVVSIWGYGGLVVGLFFAGVGVVPVALLASLVHADWAALAQLLIMVFFAFGTRLLGIRLTIIREPQMEEDLFDGTTLEATFQQDGGVNPD